MFAVGFFGVEKHVFFSAFDFHLTVGVVEVGEERICLPVFSHKENCQESVDGSFYQQFQIVAVGKCSVGEAGFIAVAQHQSLEIG